MHVQNKITYLPISPKFLSRCVATNVHGEADTSFNITVTENIVKESLDKNQLRKYVLVLRISCLFLSYYRELTCHTTKLTCRVSEVADIDEEMVAVMEIMREVDPKEYEKYARHYGIKDYKLTLSHFLEDGEQVRLRYFVQNYV